MPAVTGPSYLTVARYHVLALSGNATAGIDDATIQSIADAWSAKADSKAFRSRYALPLVSWGPEVELIIANLTSYQVMLRGGFKPQDETDKAIADAYAEAQQWLEDVAGCIVHPDVVDSGGAGLMPDDQEQAERGWSQWGNPRGCSAPGDESEV